MCVCGGGGGGGGERRAGVVYPKALYYARAEKKLQGLGWSWVTHQPEGVNTI